MPTEWAKATGSRGSWFAMVEGERLACVHTHWCNWTAQTYHDPWVLPGRAHSDEFVDVIRDKMNVILCEDEITENPGKEPGFTRKKYIALWEVSDIAWDEDGLRFRFAKRGKSLQ